MSVFTQLKPLFYLDYLRLHAQARSEGIVSRDRKMLDPNMAEDAKTGYRATINRLFRSCLENLFDQEYFSIEKLRSSSRQHCFIIKTKSERVTNFRSDIQRGASEYLGTTEGTDEETKIKELLANRNIPIGNLLFHSRVDQRRIGDLDYNGIRALQNGRGLIGNKVECEFYRINGFLKIDAETALPNVTRSSYTDTYKTYNELKKLRQMLSAFGEIGRWFRLRDEQLRVAVSELPEVRSPIRAQIDANTNEVQVDGAAGLNDLRDIDIEAMRSSIFDGMPEHERPSMELQRRWAISRLENERMRRRAR